MGDRSPLPIWESSIPHGTVWPFQLTLKTTPGLNLYLTGWSFSGRSRTHRRIA